MPLPTRKVALKDSTLKSLKPAPKGKRTTVWDALMPNMAVRVTDKGRRSFYAVKRRAGEPQPTWHLLGQYPHMSLGEAREAAREAILTLDMGQSPKTIAEERRAAAVKAAREAASSTFEGIAEKFASSQLPNMRPLRRGKYEAYRLRQLVPALGATPITEIRRRDGLALVREIKDRPGKASA